MTDARTCMHPMKFVTHRSEVSGWGGDIRRPVPSGQDCVPHSHNSDRADERFPRVIAAGHRPGEAGAPPITGSEVTLEDGSRLPLLVEDRTGYRNLSRLLTRMKLAAPKGQAALALADLERHTDGLVCLTGGANGPLARLVRAGRYYDALDGLITLVLLFGCDRFFVEVERHFDRDR